VPHSLQRRSAARADLRAGDTLKEADERFFVNLSNPIDAAIAKGQGKGVIRNDD